VLYGSAGLVQELLHQVQHREQQRRNARSSSIGTANLPPPQMHLHEGWKDSAGNTPFHLAVMREDGRDATADKQDAVAILDALFDVTCCRETSNNRLKVNWSFDNPLLDANHICLSPMDLMSTTVPVVQAKMLSFKRRLVAWEKEDRQRRTALSVIRGGGANANRVVPIGAVDTDSTSRTRPAAADVNVAGIPNSLGGNADILPPLSPGRATAQQAMGGKTPRPATETKFDFAVVFPTAETADFEENFVNFARAEANGFSLIVTEPRMLDGTPLPDTVRSSGGSGGHRSHEGTIRKTVRTARQTVPFLDRQSTASWCYVLVAGSEAFYLDKAEDIGLSMYTLELNGRASLCQFERRHASRFQPLNR
jgi:hypothetical protein